MQEILSYSSNLKRAFEVVPHWAQTQAQAVRHAEETDRIAVGFRLRVPALATAAARLPLVTRGHGLAAVALHEPYHGRQALELVGPHRPHLGHPVSWCEVCPLCSEAASAEQEGMCPCKRVYEGARAHRKVVIKVASFSPVEHCLRREGPPRLAFRIEVLPLGAATVADGTCQSAATSGLLPGLKPADGSE